MTLDPERSRDLAIFCDLLNDVCKHYAPSQYAEVPHEKLGKVVRAYSHLQERLSEAEEERDKALSALALGGHLRPRDGKPCDYVSGSVPCNKCGWSP